MMDFAGLLAILYVIEEGMSPSQNFGWPRLSNPPKFAGVWFLSE